MSSSISKFTLPVSQFNSVAMPSSLPAAQPKTSYDEANEKKAIQEHRFFEYLESCNIKDLQKLAASHPANLTMPDNYIEFEDEFVKRRNQYIQTPENKEYFYNFLTLIYSQTSHIDEMISHFEKLCMLYPDDMNLLTIYQRYVRYHCLALNQAPEKNRKLLEISKKVLEKLPNSYCTIIDILNCMKRPGIENDPFLSLNDDILFIQGSLKFACLNPLSIFYGTQSRNVSYIPLQMWKAKTLEGTHYKEAVAIYERVFHELLPKNDIVSRHDVLINIICLYEDLKDTAKQYEYLKVYIKEFMPTEMILVKLVETCPDQDLLECHNYALRHHPFIARIWKRFANSSISSQEKLQALNISIKLDPSDHEPYFTRGMLHWDRENYQLALADFEKAANISDDPKLNYYRAACLLKLDHSKATVLKAVEILAKGKNLESEEFAIFFLELLWRHDFVYSELNSIAAPACKKIMGGFKKGSSAWIMAFKIKIRHLYQSNNFAGAKKYEKILQSQCPGQEMAQELLLMKLQCHERKGNDAAASICLENLLEYDPENVELRSKLNEIEKSREEKLKGALEPHVDNKPVNLKKKPIKNTESSNEKSNPEINSVHVFNLPVRENEKTHKIEKHAKRHAEKEKAKLEQEIELRRKQELEAINRGYQENVRWLEEKGGVSLLREIKRKAMAKDPIPPARPKFPPPSEVKKDNVEKEVRKLPKKSFLSSAFSSPRPPAPKEHISMTMASFIMDNPAHKFRSRIETARKEMIIIGDLLTLIYGKTPLYDISKRTEDNIDIEIVHNALSYHLAKLFEMLHPTALELEGDLKDFDEFVHARIIDRKCKELRNILCHHNDLVSLDALLACARLLCPMHKAKDGNYEELSVSPLLQNILANSEADIIPAKAETKAFDFGGFILCAPSDIAKSNQQIQTLQGIHHNLNKTIPLLQAIPKIAKVFNAERHLFAKDGERQSAIKMLITRCGRLINDLDLRNFEKLPNHQREQLKKLKFEVFTDFIQHSHKAAHKEGIHTKFYVDDIPVESMFQIALSAHDIISEVELSKKIFEAN